MQSELGRPTRPLACRLAWLLVGLAAGSTIGCGTRHTTLPVTGLVTFHGQPVAGATLTFFCAAGRPATGITGDDGHFRLTTFTEGDGAPPGTHRVTVTKRVLVESEHAPGALAFRQVPSTLTGEVLLFGDFLPVRYGDMQRTPLETIVKVGQPNDFRFELAD